MFVLPKNRKKYYQLVKLTFCISDQRSKTKCKQWEKKEK